MNKIMKKMVLSLEDSIGEYGAGLVIARILDALQDKAKNGPFELRSLELTINGMFNYELLKEKEEYEQEG